MLNIISNFLNTFIDLSHGYNPSFANSQMRDKHVKLISNSTLTLILNEYHVAFIEVPFEGIYTKAKRATK